MERKAESIGQGSNVPQYPGKHWRKLSESIFDRVRDLQFIDSAGDEAYAEIQFFFQADVDDEILTLALISRYSPPEQDLLEASSKTLWVCEELDEATSSMEIIEVETIRSVVAMVPFDDGRVFMVEKMGLEIGSMAGVDEVDSES